MRRTSRLIVLFGIGLAVLVFVLIVVMLPGGGGGGGGGGIGQNATPSPPANVTVVTAAQDIALGTQVTAQMLSSTTLPSTSVSSDTFRDPSQVIGQIARRPILTGAQVHKADFDINATSQVLNVPAGKRALAVSVSELTGVGKLIHIGDTVDLVLTFDEATIKVLTLPQGATTPAHDDGFRPLTVKAPALLQNIQVIGTIDSAAAAAAPTPTQAPQASAAPAASAPPVLTGTNKLIILAVTDAQAEAILFARTGGTIDLILRSVADAGAQPVTTTGVILKTMFQTYGVLPPYVLKQFPIYLSQQP